MGIVASVTPVSNTKATVKIERGQRTLIQGFAHEENGRFFFDEDVEHFLKRRGISVHDIDVKGDDLISLKASVFGFSKRIELLKKKEHA